MKKTILIFCLILLFMSCKKDEVVPKDANGLEYSTINEWIYSTLSTYYLWNSTLPVYSPTSSEPTAYFKTLKNKDDRFSAIFDNYTEIENSLNGISAAEIGFEFQLYYMDTYHINLIGVVTYVKYNTPAERIGIKRGYIFTKVNGQQLTVDNYNSLINYFYNSSATADLTFATSDGVNYAEKTPISISKITNYVEDPVYLDTVYTIQNKKIGYVVYNFFANDPNDSTMVYDLKLNTIFGKFKQQNINELIVDLRYNHGGMISSAINLASMMVPNLESNMVFIKTKFNNNYTNYYNSAEFKNKYPKAHPFYSDFSTEIEALKPKLTKTPIQNTGNNLYRIFFITGSGTASASEMVINGLKPFLPCILVGDTTVGKNVGSTLISDDQNPKNKWAMLPIILKYFNKNDESNFTAGFVPDFYVKDNEGHQLGDVNEWRLAQAISQITGISSAPAAKAPAQRRVAVKSSLDFKPVRNVMIVDKMRVPNLKYTLK